MDSNDESDELLESLRDDPLIVQLDGMEARLLAQLRALGAMVREVRDLLRDQRGDRARIDRLEQRVDVLEKRG